MSERTLRAIEALLLAGGGVAAFVLRGALQWLCILPWFLGVGIGVALWRRSAREAGDAKRDLDRIEQQNRKRGI